MAKAKARQHVHIIKEKRQQAPVEKAGTSVQRSEHEEYNAGDWIMPPNDLTGLRNLVKTARFSPSASEHTKIILPDSALA